MMKYPYISNESFTLSISAYVYNLVIPLLRNTHDYLK